MKKQEVFGLIILFICAVIWGSAFIAQSMAAGKIGAWMYNGCRFLVGGIILIPLIIILDLKKKKREDVEEDKDKNKKPFYYLLIAGSIIGLLLALASFLQQKGIETIPAGKAGFITGFYLVLVPIFSFIFFRQKLKLHIYIAAVLGLLGLYLLSVTDGFSSIAVGDIYVIACAFVFTLQILGVDYFVKKVDPIKLSCVQMLFCGTFSLILSLCTEKTTWNDIVNCLGPILYAGIMSCGVAYTLQIVGQKLVNATIASLIMSLESTFSVIFGVIILHEYLSPREIWGCVVMFLAICISQIDFKQIFDNIFHKKKEV
ncbi:MAG: DMT family transporter [Bacilli bacterium]